MPSGVVLLYWLFYLGVHGLNLRSLIARQVLHRHPAYFVAFCLSMGLAFLEFTLEWLVPKKRGAYEKVDEPGECPYESADIFSVLAFSWM